MDWSRTKTIFIVTFLFLNTFLAYQLVDKQSYENILSEQNENEQTFEELVETENIVIDAELPEHENLPQLIVETAPVSYDIVEEFYGSNSWFEDLDEDIVDGSLELTLILSSNFSVDDGLFSSVNAFVEEQILEGEYYSFGGMANAENTDNVEMNFYRDHEGYTLYGSGGNAHLVITVNESREITVAEQQFLNIDVREEFEELELITAADAIEALIDEQVVTRNATIHDVELAYYSANTDGERAVYIPVYRIRASDDVYEEDPPFGDFYIVNADSGRVTSDESLSDE
ncbi:hypothetical protein JCM19037_1732 [Geomicrobium sp. JCM 19037]|uniref:two-component system regulatory protein YycI n=1 Tax=unclassified Geomicrobium TaxID=2628951 RepID=UPI00045F31BC|nr:two-component system regulatory protein YycI [Geomicrobium sp. JCM 19037]GAK03409.1 hypothetical protein JCM19037_1732 [Geomicrobium sp. JCM 19037]